MLLWIDACQAYPYYLGLVPNGDSVPNTCATDDGEIWTAVAHQNIDGGGARNSFGAAFAISVVSHNF